MEGFRFGVYIRGTIPIKPLMQRNEGTLYYRENGNVSHHQGCTRPHRR